jgi:hypothetical protein
MSLCFFSFTVPSFAIGDFLPGTLSLALPSIPILSLSAPVCLADEF